jgi:RNA polymerase sigma-70 factor (ECF subfamily)
MACDWVADGRNTVLGGVGLEINRRLDRFLSGVERRALRMAAISTGSTEEALDIVQDAMMKFATRYAGHDEADWSPLFHRVLQNAVTDWHRRSRVRNRWRSLIGRRQTDDVDADPMQEVADPLAREPGTKLAQAQALRRLEQAIGELPLRQQQAFMLRLWEGMNVRQAAAAMGCTEGSVKTHYSRAVSSLRDKLDAHWP